MAATWRLIRSGCLDGAENMAWDEALLESVATGASPPVLRLYRWQPPAVSLGYGQRNAGVINLDVCRRLGIEVVRRITGGRAVFHDQEVTYAVIAPLAGCFNGGVLDCYQSISRALQAAFELLDLKSELVPRQTLRRLREQSRPGERSAVCFTAPSQFELVVQGRKVAGSAQKRKGNSFLQHGSLPVEMNLNALAQIFSSSGRERAVDLIGHEQIGWLNLGRTRPITLDELESAVIKGFETIESIQWREEGLSLPEQAKVAKLTGKYRDRGWTETGDWTPERNIPKTVL